MKSICLHFIFHVIIAITSLGVIQAAPVLDVNNAIEQGFSLNAKMDLLVDVDGTLTLDQVMSSKNFELAGEKTPNFGFSSSVYWVRFSLLNSTDQSLLLVELGYTFLDYVSLFSPDSAGGFREKISGDMLPFSERARDHRTVTFELAQEPSTTATYYLRIQTTSSVQIPVRVYTEASFGEMSSNENTMLGGYYGIFIVMILFNGLLWISLKDKIYGYYILFLSSYLLSQLVFNGNAHRLFLGDFPTINNKLVPMVCCLVFVSISLFCRSFLDLATTEKRLSAIFVWLERVGIVLVLVSAVVPYSLAVKFVALTAVLIPPGLIYAGIKRAVRGYAPARIYVLGWFSLLGGITIFSFRTVGLLPANIFTQYALQVGSVFEVALLSLALADRINVIQENEASAQKSLLENFKELAHEHQGIEKLDNENRALNVEIEESSHQLIMADKLATLGSLAAGVAHDIANPASLIQNGAVAMNQNFQKFGDQIGRLLGNDSAEAREVYTAFRGDLDKGEQALRDVTLGAERISSINTAIRNQSRSDPNPELFDVATLIDECVTVLGSKLKQAEVEILCQSNLKGWGRRSHIGQVITNIVSNAVDAARSNIHNNPVVNVKISVELGANCLVFSVSDSGAGVLENLRDKILEPFFTTKDVGKGTGLGMPICLRILEAHGGTLSIDSDPLLGGAAFSFSLPNSPVSGVQTTACES
jgi:signal transduction histidine kinase